jgi:hypothetical protein
MIPWWRTAKPSGASGCIAPIAACAADAGALLPFFWRTFCRVTRCGLRWCGRGWSNCWPDFPSRRRRKNCGCPLRWKRSTGWGANCVSGWKCCAPGFAGSNPRRPARTPIPCAKPSSISKPSLQATPVHRLIFSFVFRRPSWVEVLADFRQTSGFGRITTAGFLPTDFSGGRQHDNTIPPILDHPVASRA